MLLVTVAAVALLLKYLILFSFSHGRDILAALKMTSLAVISHILIICHKYIQIQVARIHIKKYIVKSVSSIYDKSSGI